MLRMDGIDLDSPDFMKQLAREPSPGALDKRAQPRFAVQFIKLRNILARTPFLKAIIGRSYGPERSTLAAKVDIDQSNAKFTILPTSRPGLDDYVPEHRKAKKTRTDI